MKLLKVYLLLFLLIGLNAINIYAQNSKVVVLNSFSEVSVSSGIDLYLTQGNTENLKIEANNELIKDVIVTQNAGKVTIKYKEGINWSRLFNNQSIKVYMNYKSLKSISASGGSDIYAQNSINSNTLNLTASGGSDLKLTLQVKDLNLTISGGSDANLKGNGENLLAVASGGSDINAFTFVVNNAKVAASGGSDIKIFVRCTFFHYFVASDR